MPQTLTINFPDRVLLSALQEAYERGELITVLSPFEEGPTRLVDVPVIDVDTAAGKFRVKRVGDDSGKWLKIAHILSVKFSSGQTIDSPEGQAYWETIQGRRDQKAEWHAELSTPHRAPDISKAPYGVSAQLVGDGTRIPGPPGSKRDVELWMVQSRHSGLTGIDVKDAMSAKRVCGLVEASYWEMAHAWLTSEFMWPDWIRNNEIGPLVPHATVTKVFRWAQANPSDLVNLFIAKSWAKHRLFKPSENQLTEADARRLTRLGLCSEAAKAPLEVLRDFALSRDIRSVLKARGLKSANRDHGLAQLQEIGVTEADAVREELCATPGFEGKFCLFAPCGLTWGEWQDVRTWHHTMVGAFMDFI